MIQNFSPQEILLNTPRKTPFLYKKKHNNFLVPEDFYLKGFAVLDNIPNIEQARIIVEKLITNIDTKRLPLLEVFKERIQLAKIDEIPVCTDVVESSYQVLHLDMGQPFTSKEPQNMYLFTILYRDSKKPQTKAKTRLLNLKGFFKDVRWGGTSQIEKRLIEYVKKYGDGWVKPTLVNTYRIACFARILDAVAGNTQLSQYIDKTVGQWYENNKNLSAEENLKREYEFFVKHGISLSDKEEFIQLKPGQALIFDNTRVVHGRFGKRREKEVWQIMYGVHNATPADIDEFRESFVNLLTYNSNPQR